MFCAAKKPTSQNWASTLLCESTSISKHYCAQTLIWDRTVQLNMISNGIYASSASQTVPLWCRTIKHHRGEPTSPTTVERPGAPRRPLGPAPSLQFADQPCDDLRQSEFQWAVRDDYCTSTAISLQSVVEQCQLTMISDGIYASSESQNVPRWYRSIERQCKLRVKGEVGQFFIGTSKSSLHSADDHEIAMA